MEVSSSKTVTDLNNCPTAEKKPIDVISADRQEMSEQSKHVMEYVPKLVEVPEQTLDLVKSRDPEIAFKMAEAYDDLNLMIENTGDNIKKIVGAHEKDFLAAFEQKMFTVQRDMTALKEKASAQRHKAKVDARIINLEKERDWFRDEALKLDKMCKDHKMVLTKLKTTFENV